MRTRSLARAESAVNEAAFTDTARFYVSSKSNVRKFQTTDASSSSSSKRVKYAEKDLSTISCKELRETCRANNWLGYSKFKRKHALLQFVESQMIRFDTALFNNDLKLMYRATDVVNKVDAITLEDLSTRSSCYLFRLSIKSEKIDNVRKEFTFCPVALVSYITSQGSIQNPLTRTDMSDLELLELEHRYLSCIRAHNNSPKTKKGLIGNRTDLNTIRIAPVPSEEDLQIDIKEDEMPGPVNGFAPWLVDLNLKEFASKRKLIVNNRMQHDQTITHLTNQVVGWIQGFDTMLDPGLLGEENITVSGEVLGVLLRDIIDRFCTCVESLMDIDLHEALQICIGIHEHIQIMQSTHIIIIASCWRWIGGFLANSIWNTNTSDEIQFSGLTDPELQIIRSMKPVAELVDQSIEEIRQRTIARFIIAQSPEESLRTRFEESSEPLTPSPTVLLEV